MSFSFPESEAASHCAGRVPRQREGSPQCGLSGLVHSQTSRTPILLDPLKSRMRRMRTSVITGARLHQESVTKGGFRGRWALLTPTYAAVDGWKPEHISHLLGCIKMWFKRRGCRFHYVWVAELQQRGAMHYHILIWLPKGLTLPMPDKQGWWPHGWTKIEWARNPVGYMAKYSSKGDGPVNFPKGARIHGCGGLRGEQLQESRFWKRPTWLRDVTRINQTIRRRAGAGWFDLESGQEYQSPWIVVFKGGQCWLHERTEQNEAPPLPDELPEWFKTCVDFDMSLERILEFASLHGHSLDWLGLAASPKQGDNDAALAV